MAISFDNALGIHQHTVGVRERNAEVNHQYRANQLTLWV